MEQRDLVHREGVAEDGRGTEVTLTETGITAIMTAAPLHVESVRRHLIEVLTPAQLATLAEIGETIRARMGVERKT